MLKARVEPNTSTPDNGSLVDLVKEVIEQPADYQFGDARITAKNLLGIFVVFLNGLASAYNKPIRARAESEGKKISEIRGQLIGNYDVIKAIFNDSNDDALSLVIPRANLRRFGNQVKALLKYDSYVNDDDYETIVNFMAADMAERPNNVKFTMADLTANLSSAQEGAASDVLESIAGASV